MGVKVRIIVSLFAVITVAVLLIACAPERAEYSKFESPSVTETVEESATEQPKAIGADEYFCTVKDENRKRELKPALSKGEYRFYLPGGIDLNNLTFNCYIGENYSAKINGKTYTESLEIKIDPLETEHINITFINKNGSSFDEKYTFFISSANIICLDIDESKGKIKAMHNDIMQQTYCYGTLSYIAMEEQYDFASAFSLKGRGNATWGDAKKGYALKLYKSGDYSEKNKISLSGMGSSANWVLLANHRDRTLIRTALAQTLAKRLGMENAVEFTFADLYMNGEYLGLYMITEKKQSGEEQVDIQEATDDNIEGGYLLEFDNYNDTPQFKLKKSELRVTVNSPDNLSSYTAIEKLLNEAEAAINHVKGYNKQTGKYWHDYIDINSFAILWIVREYTLDFDATVNFRFYYNPSDGKIHGGPAWDFDNSMARTGGIYADPEYMLIESGERNSVCWLTKLTRFSAFREEIVRLYNEHIELFTTSHSDSIYALANHYYTELSYSIEQNFTVWKSQLANKNWNTPKNLTYDGHFEILTDFLKERNIFWSTYIPGLVD